MKEAGAAGHPKKMLDLAALSKLDLDAFIKQLKEMRVEIHIWPFHLQHRLLRVDAEDAAMAQGIKEEHD